jgi:2-polyprenyl-3-methyl-5-hydroxy-6-metoxy-1,4-benzoquinol methylase
MKYQSYEHDSLPLDPKSPFYLDHVSRYWWAAERSKGKSVLDCATGKGYGAYIVSLQASEVLGIDLNEKSVELAKETFKSSQNLNFKVHDALKLNELDKKFDIITAFEVIEHLHPDQANSFISSLKSALNSGGELLLSTPNHDVVLKSRSAVPSFHINNYKAKDLKRFLGEHFNDVTMIGQYRSKGRLKNIIFDFDKYNLRHSIKNLFKAPSPTIEMNEDEKQAEVKNQTILIDNFKNPPEEYKEYSFSQDHWRQAGLTVCICKDPK